MVALVKLLVSEQDSFGYITHVFECLEDYMIKQTKYIMCTQFPNWDCKKINIGDIGYLNYKELHAGIDKWFNGKEMVPYCYDNIQFIKFVPKSENQKFVM